MTRDQIVELEHKTDMLSATASQLLFIGADKGVIVEEPLPSRRRVETPRMLMRVD